MNDLLLTLGNYTSSHQPQTVTDTAGQSTAITYNAAGQTLTITNAKGETTTYAYDSAGKGYVQSLTGAIPGAVTSYTYDGYGHLRTITEPDGYGVMFDYDLLDRRTRITYPDSTYEETTYNKLDAVEWRDRLGRRTRRMNDAQRRLVAITDPLGRTVTQQWCSCGTLEALRGMQRGRRPVGSGIFRDD